MDCVVIARCVQMQSASRATQDGNSGPNDRKALRAATEPSQALATANATPVLPSPHELNAKRVGSTWSTDAGS